jgi:hypothetical protein
MSAKFLAQRRQQSRELHGSGRTGSDDGIPVPQCLHHDQHAMAQEPMKAVVRQDLDPTPLQVGRGGLNGTILLAKAHEPTRSGVAMIGGLIVQV